MHRRGRGACILIAALCALVLVPNVPASAASGLAPYKGLGTWIDVYDWSETYGGAAVGAADIDRMASLGVQTVYIQATRWDAETVILEPDRLLSLIKRARARGMRVVAWYLPDLGDPNDDMRRLTAVARTAQCRARQVPARWWS